jgi:excinuclease ABC subunit A
VNSTPDPDKYRRTISIRGAREHNLKALDVDIPRDKLVVITGLSGSGKSSLAFDTIFAEGQRKYMESLSAYARQFLDVLAKPDVEDIEGLPPTIAIEQRSGSHNPRSTVATSTEIYDYLRLLFARVGTPTCWHPTKKKKDGRVVSRCGKQIDATSASQIVETIMRWDAGTRLMILSPVIRDKKGFHKEICEDLQRDGYVRIRVNSDVRDIREALKEEGENPLGLGRYEKHSIEAVVDRIVINDEARQRLVESVETALKLSEGLVIIASQQGKDAAWKDHLFSDTFACSVHPQRSIEELEPRLFSFNSPHGACKTCSGLGTHAEFDESLLVPDDSLSLRNGAIKPFKLVGPMRGVFKRRLRQFSKDFGVELSTPFRDIPPKLQHALLFGQPEAKSVARKHWPGIIELLHNWWQRTESDNIREWLSQFQQEQPCPDCYGDRLRIQALSVFIPLKSDLPAESITRRAKHGLRTDARQLNIADFTHMSIDTALRVIGSLKLTKEQSTIAEPILREVQNRLGFLASVGLEYLSLDRRMGTLSGGEAQRIRLASQVGSKLVGACYVLDEPTIGLHQRDNARLIGTLRHLTDIGNTVLVVEHDEEMIHAADHILDIGPGPGVHGGKLVAQGTINDITACKNSLTGDYLSGRKTIDAAPTRRPLSTDIAITIKGARENNLQSIDVAFPLGGIVCVTGVSGSGKSTLVNDILLKATRKKLFGSRDVPGAHDRINGLHKIDRVIEVDQSPIGRTPRSNAATYTNAFDEIRKVFAKTKESSIRGYLPGRFSFNVKGGRCEACQGQGVKKIEMHFLPDVFVTCETCRGARYNPETLQVRYRAKTIADVLNMTIEDARDFFEHHPKIHAITDCLHDVGLDYVKLGQPSPTLSGGEAQRVKLATELSKGINATGPAPNTLYILDEPTTGLHFEDIRKLLRVLNRLADAGNTLVVIEHNLDVIKCADWIIDLGPEGGSGGGTIVAQGTPEQVAASKRSYTGQYLDPLLTSRSQRNKVTKRRTTKKSPRRATRSKTPTRQ